MGPCLGFYGPHRIPVQGGAHQLYRRGVLGRQERAPRRPQPPRGKGTHYKGYVQTSHYFDINLIQQNGHIARNNKFVKYYHLPR